MHMNHSVYVSTFPVRTFLSGLIRFGNVGRLFFPVWNLDGDELRAGLSLSFVLMPVSTDYVYQAQVFKMNLSGKELLILGTCPVL